jgi:hypothetical protein
MTTKPEESPKGTMLHRNPGFHTCEIHKASLRPQWRLGSWPLEQVSRSDIFKLYESVRRQLEERLSWVSDNCPVRRICSDFIQGQAAAHALPRRD